MTNEERPPTLAARTRLARYAAAVVVVLVGIGWLLLGSPTVCHQQLPSNGSAPVEVCGPPATTDPQTLAFLLVALLLLAPDLTEVGIAGITVKRVAEQARADAASARADVASLRLAQVSQQLVGVAASTTVDVNDGGADLVRALGDLGLLRTDLEHGDSAQAGPDDDARATLVAAAMAGMVTLLPDEWQPGTLLAAAGELVYVAGAEVEQPVIAWLTGDSGAIAKALAGEATATSRSRSRPAVVAVPAADAGGAVVGAVAVVLPASVQLVPGTIETAASLQPAAKAFAVLVRAIMAGGRGRRAGGQSWA